VRSTDGAASIERMLAWVSRSGVRECRSKPGESTRWNSLDLGALHPIDDRFQGEYLGLESLSSGSGYRDRRRGLPPFERLRHLYQLRLLEHEEMTAKISRCKSKSFLQVAELHRAPLEREGQYSQASPLVDNVLKFRGLVTQAISPRIYPRRLVDPRNTKVARSERPRELRRSELVPLPHETEC
jgi:hypothetical protein